jgi:hypothetical protein
MKTYAMIGSLRSQIAAARDSHQLFFAALVSAERIASVFGQASAILDSGRVYTTADTAFYERCQAL